MPTGSRSTAGAGARGGAPTSVGLVGVGTIGAVHLQVLSMLPDVRVAFTVDPRPTGADQDQPPRHASLAAALAVHEPPDLVVLATPSDTHLDLAEEALTRTGATVLSEKPLTRDDLALRRFEGRHEGELGRLRVVNHFAFSPEVVWAAEAVAARGWGAPRHVLASFDDPYVGRPPAARDVYVSSWVDSGANQLGMLARFAEGWVVRHHDADEAGLRSVTVLDFDGGSATLASSWWTGDSSKQTVLRWGSGREVLLDHTAMTGLLLDEGRVVEHLGNDGSVGRKVAHYLPMYRALLADTDAHLLGLGLARQVAQLLSAATRVGGAAPPVAWSLRP